MIRNLDKYLGVILIVLIGACIYQKRSALSHLDSNITLKGPSYVNLGNIEDGKIAKTEFQIENISPHSICIDSISASCACTLITIDRDKIEAGGHAIVHAEMHTGNNLDRMGATAKMSWHDLRTLSKGEFFTKLVCKVQTAARLSKPNLNFGFVDHEATQSFCDLTITNGDLPCNWTRATISPSDSSITYKIVDQQSHLIHMRFFLDPFDLPLGEYRGSVSITLSDPTSRESFNGTVPVLAKIAGPIDVQPLSLYLGLVKDPVEIRGTLLIASNTHHSFAVESITDSNGRQQPDLGIHAVDQNFTKVSYSVKPKEVDGSGGGVLSICVQAENKYTIKVPYMYYFSKNGN